MNEITATNKIVLKACVAGMQYTTCIRVAAWLWRLKWSLSQSPIENAQHGEWWWHSI